MQQAVSGMTRRSGVSRRALLGMACIWAVAPQAVLAAAGARPRLVTLFQGATDTAVALGVMPVGVVESWQDPPVYPYLRAALCDATLVGLETQPSLEDIVMLQPDLIVASRFRHEKIAPLLTRIAPVIMLEDVYRFHDTLASMARALGKRPAADWLESQYAARIVALRARLAVTLAPHWPMTVSLIDVRADQIRSYLPASFGGEVLSALGFRWNATARQASGVMLKLGGVESVSAIDASLFFVMRHSNSPAVTAHYERLIHHPLWQRLAAPCHGQVVPVDTVAWSLSGGMLGVFAMLDDIEHWLDRREVQS
ncbi:ABC transporter substrate-binding protein [Larsenimonas rhizosphaerae]|uniref:Iron-siderophore ABC transporter substrate-binding protein n=1 Tax=Larsenimonas rhizosphaerae TaxID=2944682 RepID=A0AA41ZGC3_9GAMM|nr:iron-siderophore ABC transporter substrate-binding protein [Larsenimonas rhizosphaerae]MCX2524769.1 iron-siderophore ABC transporter substrate-binding protein [Larsenimonas rhizosphaerae]